MKTRAQTHDMPLTLAIDQISPVDISDPQVATTIAEITRSLTDPRLLRILTIRTAIQQYLGRKLAGAGFVHPPVYMLSGCTDPLNHQTFPARLNYYGEEVSVTQSLILQKILMVMLSPVDRVFWASPNIRMEMGVADKSHKYAAEFMQVDFEQRDATMDEVITFIGETLAGLHRHLNRHHGAVVRSLRGDLLPDLTLPLARHDLADIKERHALDTDDEVERFLAERAGGRPFVLTNLKREAYDCFEAATGRFLNYDIVYPPCGANQHPVECLSGAERTRTLPQLRARMEELGYPMAYFEPFFAVFAAAGGQPQEIRCAGGGFGIERLTYALLGLESLAAVYPFPRGTEGRIVI